MKRSMLVRSGAAVAALAFAAACSSSSGSGSDSAGGAGSGAPGPDAPGTGIPGAGAGATPGEGDPMLEPPTASVDVPAATCAPSARVAPRLYRLSAAQFGNALRDLLRLPSSPELVGDTEATLVFYPREDAPVQASIAEGFSRATRQAIDTLDVAALSGCTLAEGAASDGELACARAFLEDFASRAFRRPLDAADREALLLGPESPFGVGSATSAASGVRLTLESILNAASFLYRKELGSAGGRLSSLETA
ncbi:MAG TPA: DUF1595 domain-containing protein, partial [Polyangiaceae bacterium]|nr:DUF1595 domain-containing protein [Polyangiaceae bacterium]